MKKFFKNIICISLISFYFLKVEQVQSLVPYYYFPTIKNLQKESLSIGQNAYQLLYYGQYEKSLNLSTFRILFLMMNLAINPLARFALIPITLNSFPFLS